MTSIQSTRKGRKRTKNPENWKENLRKTKKNKVFF